MDEHEHDGPPVLDEETRATWRASDAPEGFAARVMNAHVARNSRAPEMKRSSRTPLRLVAGPVLALAAAAFLIFLTKTSLAGQGDVHASSRQTVQLGGRAVAVLESGAHVAFDVKGNGEAAVRQDSGRVFYRVEPGRAFVVTTPAGRVEVLGTCFDVEVKNMTLNRQSIGGAVTGAAIAAAVVVTLYEGKVVLANEHGTRTLAPGEQSEMRASESPAEARDVHKSGAAGSSVEGLPELDENASPEEIRTQNAALRAAFQEQQTRIQTLQRQLAIGPSAPAAQASGGGAGFDLTRRTVDLTPAELAELAQKCEVRIDLPPVMSLTQQNLAADDDHVKELGLATTELPAVNDALRRIHDGFIAQLRQLYVEATGDAQNANTLSPGAMLEEIEDKAPEDSNGLSERIARERAGLAQPPSDLSLLSPNERARRLLASLGDDLEHTLAQTLGPERAHELRATQGGWPWGRSTYRGCTHRH